ncbi:MAG TPA: hypothetical protein VIG25_18590 [Pyrinomonadaceae bacterium]
MRRFAPQLSAQLFCVPLLFFFVSNSHGQISSRSATQQQVQNREWALGINRRDVNANQFAREKLLAQEALRNDFRKLQIVNNQLMAGMFERSGAERITQKEIRSSLGEIKKLAERLRSNLAIPKMKADEPTNNLTLEPGLLQLDKAVMSFVENPQFQQPRVYDIELASRARKDLGEVLRLAEVLRKLSME